MLNKQAAMQAGTQVVGAKQICRRTDKMPVKHKLCTGRSSGECGHIICCCDEPAESMALAALRTPDWGSKLLCPCRALFTDSQHPVLLPHVAARSWHQMVCQSVLHQQATAIRCKLQPAELGAEALLQAAAACPHPVPSSAWPACLVCECKDQPDMSNITWLLLTVSFYDSSKHHMVARIAAAGVIQEWTPDRAWSHR